MVYTISDFNRSHQLLLKQQVKRYLDKHRVSPISDVTQDDQQLVIYAKSLEEYYVRQLFLLSD